MANANHCISPTRPILFGLVSHHFNETSGFPTVEPAGEKGVQSSPRVSSDALLALVHSMVPVADGVVSIEFRPAHPDVIFPAFTAGAHIDLYLPNGMVRSYSLHNSPEDIGRYAIGVLRDRSSRGGSTWLHSQLHVGDVLSISTPRNNFALVEDAPRSVLVSGGIGVTPLLSMIRRLAVIGGEAHILYYARNRKEAPFHRNLAGLVGEKVAMQCHFSDEAGSTTSIERYLSAYTPEDHFYCCGPSRMLDAFEAACKSLGFANAHVERFRAVVDSDQSAPGGECIVELAKSGRTMIVPKDKALLGSLLAAGVEVQYSCGEGVCGTCETRIIFGQADHRDGILTKSQKTSNSSMMVCVSRCRSDHMVLDL